MTILTERECKLDLWPGFCTTIRSSIKVSIFVRKVSIHSLWRNETQRWMFWSGSYSVLFRIYHGMIRPGAEFTQPTEAKGYFWCQSKYIYSRSGLPPKTQDFSLSIFFTIRSPMQLALGAGWTPQSHSTYCHEGCKRKDRVCLFLFPFIKGDSE